MRHVCDFPQIVLVSYELPNRDVEGIILSFLCLFFALTHRLLVACILNRVENKIRTNTTAETKKGQGSLFASMRKLLQPEPTLNTSSICTDAVAPYLKDPSEEMTQSDDSCWAGICAIFGTEATKQEAVASPTSVSCQDIVLSICDAHHKLGQVHDNVVSGCCDPSLVRKELKNIHTSLSKMTADK